MRRNNSIRSRHAFLKARDPLRDARVVLARLSLNKKERLLKEKILAFDITRMALERPQRVLTYNKADSDFYNNLKTGTLDGGIIYTCFAVIVEGKV